MPLAERSYKATVEDQQHIGFVFEIRKPDSLPVGIGQRKIGRGLIKLDTITH